MTSTDLRKMPGENLLLDDDYCMTLSELCHACNMHAEWVIELIDEGVIDPVGESMPWQFSASNLRRIQTIKHLQQDLGVNLAGAALALDLLEEVSRLRNRLNILEFD